MNTVQHLTGSKIYSHGGGPRCQARSPMVPHPQCFLVVDHPQLPHAADQGWGVTTWDNENARTEPLPVRPVGRRTPKRRG